MRQVNRDEIATVLRFALGQLPASVLNDFMSREVDRRRRGAAMVADRLVASLHRFEILSSAPLDHPAGDDLFKNSGRRGSGEELGSGVPMAGNAEPG